MSPSAREDIVRIMGIAGGSGSGKTTFARQLQTRLGDPVCAILSQDHYYIDQSARFRGDGQNVNFDHPEALDFALLASHLRDLKLGRAVSVPIYDFATHKRLPETSAQDSRAVILVDGTLILSQPTIRECLDFSLFIETPEELRYERRLRRDTHERGRTAEGVKLQFDRQVKPMHDLYVEPSKNHAGLVVSGNKPFQPHLDYWCRKLA